ncbi:MAG: 6,7-dimethyl-8-ribityllumazine synthase [Bacteroidetes bacterium]|nr:6,7-dimethyl-8-ribityllumazine synthase [Bacteroidota bacterium]
MSSSDQNLSTHDSASIPDASAMSFGIAVSEWNQEITEALLKGCHTTLLQYGCAEENIHLQHVPGSFELPSAAQALEESQHPDAIICLGCVIKGETSHNEYINHAVANGLVQLSIKYNKPFVFGVLTPDNKEQALARAGGEHGNKGVEAAITAIKMAALRQ